MEQFNITQSVLDDIAKLPARSRKLAIGALGTMEYKRCGEDPLYWLDSSRHLMPYVYTLDPHELYTCNLCGDGVSHALQKRSVHLNIKHGLEVKGNEGTKGYFTLLNPIRPFPIHPYMPPLIDMWLSDSMSLVQKSRDVMATWLFVALYTWDTIFHAGRQNIFQSKTASDTDELVRRAYHMYNHQPRFLKEVVKGEYFIGQSRSGVFKLPTLNSEILGFGQGADQVRQYHPSGIYMDEMAFQDKAFDAFCAVKPAIQNGGRFTGVSSAAPSWFYLACSDRSELEGV